MSRERLERVRERDPQALGELFDQYFDMVHALAYRLLGDRESAEDMTQEVFLKVHRAADRLDSSRDPGPWLAAIVTNACRDRWRSSTYRMGRKSSSIDDPDGGGVTLTGGSDPEHGVLTEERRRLVREAIDRLPEQYREVILLYDYQGLGHQEIAALMGLEHTAARKRYSRALAALGMSLRELLG